MLLFDLCSSLQVLSFWRTSQLLLRVDLISGILSTFCRWDYVFVNGGKGIFFVLSGVLSFPAIATWFSEISVFVFRRGWVSCLFSARVFSKNISFFEWKNGIFSFFLLFDFCNFSQQVSLSFSLIFFLLPVLLFRKFQFSYGISESSPLKHSQNRNLFLVPFHLFSDLRKYAC